MNPEIPHDSGIENKDQPEQNNIETPKGVDETANEITHEVESSVLNFEQLNDEVSRIESSVELNNPDEPKSIKEELKIDESIEELDIKAKILKQETEKQIEWIQQNDHQWDENNFYRVVNENGYADYLEHGIVRSNPTGATHSGGNEMLSGRTTPFPSFAKGQPNLDHYSKPGESNYILESDMEMYTRGDINPVTGQQIRDKHGAAYRPVDSKTGKAISELSSEHIKDIYQKDAEGNLFKQKTAQGQK